MHLQREDAHHWSALNASRKGQDASGKPGQDAARNETPEAMGVVVEKDETP